MRLIQFSKKLLFVPVAAGALLCSCMEARIMPLHAAILRAVRSAFLFGKSIHLCYTHTFPSFKKVSGPCRAFP